MKPNLLISSICGHYQICWITKKFCRFLLESRLFCRSTANLNFEEIRMSFLKCYCNVIRTLTRYNYTSSISLKNLHPKSSLKITTPTPDQVRNETVISDCNYYELLTKTIQHYCFFRFPRTMHYFQDIFHLKNWK